MNYISEIKKFAEAECKKPTSTYGYEPFPFHFTPMAEYAKKLARKKGGDLEIILIAVWLHDIGAIMRRRKDHHITGTQIAEKKLKELGYPLEKIELVKKCIMNHRGSQRRRRKTIEEKIVAEADVLSNFDNIPGIFKAAFIFENCTQIEAKYSVRKKLQNKWRQLSFQESKDIVKPKYEAAMLLFK